MKQNALGLLIGAAALLSVYVKTSGDLRVVQRELIDTRENASRLHKTELKLIEMQSQYAASRDYWSRFEKALSDNTKVLNSAVNTFGRFQAEIEDHERRIKRLEE